MRSLNAGYGQCVSNVSINCSFSTNATSGASCWNMCSITTRRDPIRISISAPRFLSRQYSLGQSYVERCWAASFTITFIKPRDIAAVRKSNLAVVKWGIHRTARKGSTALQALGRIYFDQGLLEYFATLPLPPPL